MHQISEIYNHEALSRITNREAIFLDTNMWNKISREENDLFKSIKLHLKQLFECGKIFCPLSKDTFRELLKQNYESAKPVSEFMDSISFSLCFRSPNEIFDKEIELLIAGVIDDQNYQLNHTHIYLPISGFISSKFQLKYNHDPRNTELDGKIREFSSSTIPKAISSLSINGFVTMLKDRLPMNKFPFENQMTEQLIKRNKYAKRSVPRIRTIERTHIAKQIILPRIFKLNRILSPASLHKVVNYFNSVPKDPDESSYSHIFPLLPALNTFCEVMIYTGLNESKKFTINDFHDTEMMIVPLTYGDVFVSEDRNIRHILKKYSELILSNTTKFISSPESFLTYLESKKCA